MAVASELIPEVKIKTCRKCGALFSTSRCSECKKIYDAKWAELNRDKKKENLSAWVAGNRLKLKETKNEWRRNNPDKVKAHRNADKEANQNRSKLWYQKNKEKARMSNLEWYKLNPIRAKEKDAEWRKNNPELCRVYNQNRRALKISAGGKLSKGLAKKLLRLQKGKCACCKKPLGDNYHLDHIIPLSKGGGNTDDNIQLLTQRCNIQKSAKDPIDFMRSRGFLL